MLHNGLRVIINNFINSTAATKSSSSTTTTLYEDYNIDEVSSIYCIKKSDAFSLFGSPTLSEMYLLIQLQNYSTLSSSSTEESCLSLCRLAKSRFDSGDMKKALEILQMAKKYFPHPQTQHLWLYTLRQILFEWTFNR